MSLDDTYNYTSILALIVFSFGFYNPLLFGLGLGCLGLFNIFVINKIQSKETSHSRYYATAFLIAASLCFYIIAQILYSEMLLPAIICLGVSALLSVVFDYIKCLKLLKR